MTYKIEGALPPVAKPTASALAAPARAPAGEDAAKRIAPISGADSVRLTGEASGLQALERELGVAPAGIDVARVNQLRASIADGSYAVDPQGIADRMIALDRELSR